MTDLIKLHSEVDSGLVDKYLRDHPEIVQSNIRGFVEEISYLGGKPVLVALGGKVYKLLKDFLGGEYQIVEVKHYSYTIGKEDYRKELFDRLSRY